jgi:hypothetical protein
MTVAQHDHKIVVLDHMHGGGNLKTKLIGFKETVRKNTESIYSVGVHKHSRGILCAISHVLLLHFCDIGVFCVL